jgi:adenylate kinase family enzyme
VFRRIAIVSSMPGTGKTTLGLELARRLGLPFIEMDALNHRANWTEATPDELRTALDPVLDSDGWIIDGIYRGKLGNLVPEAADVVVWLDLPLRVSLLRLLRRSFRQAMRGEALWNGNRQTWRRAFGGRGSIVLQAAATHRSRRRRYPEVLERFPYVRLTSSQAVESWLDAVTRSTTGDR